MTIKKTDQEKMIATCQDILKSCDQPFVWEEEDTYEYDNATLMQNTCIL